LRWGRTTSKNRAIFSVPTSTPSSYYARTNLRWTPIYLVHRYYDPATGQFLSIDPDLSLTGEPYEYAGDNPITYSDSNGDSDQTCTTPFSNPYNLCFTVNSGSKGGQYVVYMAIQFNYINGPDGGCADPGPNRCNPPIYGNLTIHYGGGSGEGITYPAVSLNQARCRWP
jgi:RHS repeat-associated protein